MTATRCQRCDRTISEHWDFPEACPGFYGPWAFEVQREAREEQASQMRTNMAFGALLLALAVSVWVFL